MNLVHEAFHCIDVLSQNYWLCIVRKLSLVLR